MGHTIVDIINTFLDHVQTFIDVVERRQPHIALNLRPRRYLVDGALRTFYLGWLQCGWRGKLVRLLLLVLQNTKYDFPIHSYSHPLMCLPCPGWGERLVLPDVCLADGQDSGKEVAPSYRVNHIHPSL